MAVYIELVPLDNQNGNRGRGGGDGRSRRAGIADVRRPLRGIEIKEDTHAYFRVLKGDGTPLDLVDSSRPEGKGRAYANFILQSVQESRVERQQILETFGAPFVFFFGESPRFVDVAAVLIDSHDFNWAAEWWENYEKFLRGTRLAERGATALLHYDDVILEGYPIQAQSSRSSIERNQVQLQFRMFVTNYINVSNIGDPNFPIHSNAVIPTKFFERDDRTFAFKVDVPVTPEEQARAAYLAYIKRLGIQAVQEQISRARTIERARELQRLHALQQLGVDTDGMNLISYGKSLFQGVVAAVRGDNESSRDALERLKAQNKQALQLSMEGRDKEALDLLKTGKIGAALNTLATPSPASVSLNEALRNSLRYSASYPGADLNAFLRRIEQEQTGFTEKTTQLLENKRTMPLRTKIWDNYDEYTERGEDAGAAEEFTERTGIPVGGDVPDLAQAVEDDVRSVGGSPSAKNMYEMGLIKKNPQKGFTFGSDEFSKLTGIPVAPGDKNAFTYSKQWGSTPQVGGGAGGSLGGSFGAGIGGKNVDPQDSFSFGSGLPQGDPYGNSGLPPHAFTGGMAPDGTTLYEKKFQYGSKEDGSYFGGGVMVKSVENKDGSVQGKGFFSITVVEGELL